MRWPPSRRALAAVAAVGGLLAPAAGSPYLAQRASIDVERLAAEIADEGDRVSAVEVAGWIKDRAPGLRVIDVGPQAEFDEYHLPTAERVPMASLATALFKRSDTIVLCSEDGAHAAQAWVLLRALGYPRVFVLRGGLEAWQNEILSPTLPSNPSPAAVAAFGRQAELSRYFGGTPRRGDASPPPAGARPARRQGC